ncbi:hypothetical protein THAOC_17270 [Thalassiosira oceanica]|uniref:Uncharacterized protein n=1 Tax=Thalassiosira oceanica TaxID=159749 RepID=K0SV82_THAOC|nr:hypothetical protein THAOC_17270 [Thalassiosira oceanica]|eukprot:EJK62132.1 hypothetical protein THAOC_17270 [Thalassiosira oceanica]
MVHDCLARAPRRAVAGAAKPQNPLKTSTAERARRGSTEHRPVTPTVSTACRTTPKNKLPSATAAQPPSPRRCFTQAPISKEGVGSVVTSIGDYRLSSRVN